MVNDDCHIGDNCVDYGSNDSYKDISYYLIYLYKDYILLLEWSLGLLLIKEIEQVECWSSH